MRGRRQFEEVNGTERITESHLTMKTVDGGTVVGRNLVLERCARPASTREGRMMLLVHTA